MYSTMMTYSRQENRAIAHPALSLRLFVKSLLSRRWKFAPAYCHCGQVTRQPFKVNVGRGPLDVFRKFGSCLTAAILRDERRQRFQQVDDLQYGTAKVLAWRVVNAKFLLPLVRLLARCRFGDKVSQ